VGRCCTKLCFCSSIVYEYINYIYINIFIYIHIYSLKIRRNNDSIKIDIIEIGLGWDVDLIDVAQDSSRWWDVASMVRNYRVLQNARNFLNIWRLISLSQKTLLHEIGPQESSTFCCRTALQPANQHTKTRIPANENIRTVLSARTSTCLWIQMCPQI
jgi:hypothetical protein